MADIDAAINGQRLEYAHGLFVTDLSLIRQGEAVNRRMAMSTFEAPTRTDQGIFVQSSNQTIIMVENGDCTIRVWGLPVPRNMTWFEINRGLYTVPARNWMETIKTTGLQRIYLEITAVEMSGDPITLYASPARLSLPS